MKSFAFAAIAGLATALNTTELAYMNYLAEFGKTMNSVEEFSMRMNNFDMTDQFINQVNSENGNTWTAGHNQFSDWSREEYKNLLGLKNNDMHLNRVYETYPEATGAINWVTKGAVTPVKD